MSNTLDVIFYFIETTKHLCYNQRVCGHCWWFAYNFCFMHFRSCGLIGPSNHLRFWHNIYVFPFDYISIGLINIDCTYPITGEINWKEIATRNGHGFKADLYGLMNDNTGMTKQASKHDDQIHWIAHRIQVMLLMDKFSQNLYETLLGEWNTL